MGFRVQISARSGTTRYPTCLLRAGRAHSAEQALPSLCPGKRDSKLPGAHAALLAKDMPSADGHLSPGKRS